MDPVQLDKLRRQGLTALTAAGQEAVHVSAQMAREVPGTRAELKAALTDWAAQLSDILQRFGGEVLPDSLSVSGQTVEALIPVDRLEPARQALSDTDLRLDMVVRRQSLPPG